MLRWAAIAEAGSEHPLAQAIMTAAETDDFIPEADQFETFTGRGIRAIYEGHEIGVGTNELMVDMGIEVPNAAQSHLNKLRGGGKTAVLVSGRIGHRRVGYRRPAATGRV